MLIKKSNHMFLICAFILLLIHPIYRCITYITNIIGVTIPYLMDALYLYVLIYAVYALYKNKIRKDGIWRLGLIWLFFLINYFWSVPEAKVYYSNPDTQVMLLIYIPVSILVVSRVDEWYEIFNNNIFLILSDVIIVISFLSKLYGIDGTDYMSFSYDLLPLWGLVYISAFCYKKRVQWLFLILGIIEGVLFGARGPLVWLIILLIMVWGVRAFQENGNPKYLVYMILAIIIALVAVQYVLPNIVDSQYGGTSYIVNRIKQGNINDDSGRNSIYLRCKEILADMGINVYGLYYDRTRLPSSMYSHNFFYEVLISFGWFFGPVIILGIILEIIFPMVRQNGMGKIICIYFVCVLFLRYILSGSIFDEGNFWLFCGVMQSMNKNKIKLIRR